MNVLKRSGASAALARALAPVLRRLFPNASRDPAALEALTGNVSANLLGLGNAATPLGIEAARRMARGSATASAELCLLVVINTASVQLLPTTALAVRMAAGSAQPYDIVLPALLASLTALLTGAALTRLFFRPPFSARGRAAGRSGRRRANERGRRHSPSPPPTGQNGRRHSPSPPPTEQNRRGGAR